jgi:hypothetical protein
VSQIASSHAPFLEQVCQEGIYIASDSEDLRTLLTAVFGFMIASLVQLGGGRCISRVVLGLIDSRSNSEPPDSFETLLPFSLFSDASKGMPGKRPAQTDLVGSR